MYKNAIPQFTLCKIIRNVEIELQKKNLISINVEFDIYEKYN